MATGSDRRLFGEDYHTHFDPMKYMRHHYSSSHFDSPRNGWMKCVVNSLHNIFGEGNVNGKRLLDVGTGPSIHTVISAAPWFDEITLSDYTEQSRAALEKWVTNDPAKFDFSGCFNYISKLPLVESLSVANLENEVRSKIVGIVPCDVTNPSILQSTLPSSPFDCITSSLCLESAIPDIPAYKEAVKNMAAMLNADGHFVLVGIFGEDVYKYEGFEYHSLLLTKADVENAIAEAGLVLEVFNDFQGENNMFVLKATKSLWGND